MKETMKDYKKPVLDPFSQFKSGDKVLIGYTPGHPSWKFDLQGKRLCMYEYPAGLDLFPNSIKPFDRYDSFYIPPITEPLKARFIKRLDPNDVWVLVNVSFFDNGPTLYSIPIGFVKPIDYEY